MATVFHWPLTELLAMTPQELMFWREKARERSEQQQ
ncbi:GpE family phage tail protein [Bartonella sp. B17]